MQIISKAQILQISAPTAIPPSRLQDICMRKKMFPHKNFWVIFFLAHTDRSLDNATAWPCPALMPSCRFPSSSVWAGAERRCNLKSHRRARKAQDPACSDSPLSAPISHLL